MVNKDTTLKDFDGMLLCDRCIFTNADSIFGLKKKKNLIWIILHIYIKGLG